MTRRDGLWAVILICLALLMVAFAPALVGQSLVVVVLVSLACWGAIIGGTFALSRRISRRDRVR